MGATRTALKDLKADDPVRLGAAVAVRVRMRRVRKWASRAARTKGRDEEAVHELRVSCRRAGAVLDAYRGCLAARPRKRARRMLKRLRRAAGATRDLDVQAALWTRIAAESPAVEPGCRFMLERGRRAHRDARRVLRRVLRETDEATIRSRSRALREGVRDREDDPRLGGYAVERVRALVQPLIEWPSRGVQADAADLHAARIAEKRAQYALELFRGVLDGSSARALRRDLKALHDALGLYHDLACAGALVQRVMGGGDGPAAALEALVAELEARACAADGVARAELDAFAHAWSPDSGGLRAA